MQEAELLLSGRGNMVNSLETNFRKQVGETKHETFVSAGNIQSTAKTATITFRQKDSQAVTVMEAKDFKPTVKKPIIVVKPPNPEISRAIRAPVFATAGNGTVGSNSATSNDILAKIRARRD